MRSLGPEELTEYAIEYGLTAAIAERDYVAVRVAHAIASDPAVGDQIAIKGGFALRYGYGSPRTSKDIDGTIGTKHAALDPKVLQRVVRNQCRDLSLNFELKTPAMTADTLDFGNIGYVGPLSSGFLTLEMSYREDLILKPRMLEIDSFGVPKFAIRAMAVDEMIAEKWRCLVQRSPRKPGDPYDLWFLWTDFRLRRPRTADDIIDAAMVKSLVPKKVTVHGGHATMIQMLDLYAQTWASAIGDTVPEDAPGFAELRAAVVEAARAWTPWR